MGKGRDRGGLGRSKCGKKEDKKDRSVRLPEPCLHSITAICSVFSLKSIFIWLKPECALWSEWVCVSTANMMPDWLVSRGRGLSTAAAAELRVGGLHVQVPAMGRAGGQGPAMGWCVQGQLCMCVCVYVHVHIPDQPSGRKKMGWQPPLAGRESSLLRRSNCQHSRTDLKLCRNPQNLQIHHSSKDGNFSFQRS